MPAFNLTFKLFSSLLCSLLLVSNSLSAVDLTPAESAWLKQHPVVRIAPDPGFAPVEFFTEGNKFKGISADYLHLLEQHTGLKFETIQYPTWSDAVKAAQTRDIDLWGAVAPTAERQRYMLFTVPYLTLPAVIITHKDTDNISDMKSLIGRKTAVVKDYATHSYLENEHSEVEIIAVPDIQTGLRMVAFGLADAMVASNASASHAIETYAINNLKVVGESGYQWQLSMAARSDWPELASILDKGLQAISDDERTSIHRRWIHLSQSGWHVDRETLIKLTLAAVLLMLAMAYLWIHTLRRQVKRKTAALSEELQRREELELQLRHQATTDELTQLPNRRQITLQIKKELDRYRRYGQEFAVLLIDVDHFKLINDTLGHHAGDYVLRAISKTMQQQLRDTDALGRLGGEEFTAKVVSDSPENVRLTAERLRKSISELTITVPPTTTQQAKKVSVTISIGVACVHENSTLSSLLAEADKAMYQAKVNGRNQTRVYTPEMASGTHEVHRFAPTSSNPL